MNDRYSNGSFFLDEEESGKTMKIIKTIKEPEKSDDSRVKYELKYIKAVCQRVNTDLQTAFFVGNRRFYTYRL